MTQHCPAHRFTRLPRYATHTCASVATPLYVTAKAAERGAVKQDEACCTVDTRHQTGRIISVHHPFSTSNQSGMIRSKIGLLPQNIEAPRFITQSIEMKDRQSGFAPYHQGQGRLAAI